MEGSGEYDWQEAQDTILQRDIYILGNEQWADCTFTVGEEGSEKPFKCHRVYLAKTSPVFAAMIYGEMKKKSAEYRITDVLPEVFSLLLSYIYTGCIKFENYNIACGFLYAAKQYLMPQSLLAQCREYLKKNVKIENAWCALEFAIFNYEDEIKLPVDQILEVKAEKLFQQPEFLDISQKTLIEVLKKDKLFITSEIKVFEACLRWAKNELNRINDEKRTLRDVFSPFFPYIRFLSLSNEIFRKNKDLANVLTAHEILALLKCINMEEKHPLDGFCSSREGRNKILIINEATLAENKRSFNVTRTSTVTPTSENLEYCTFYNLAYFNVNIQNYKNRTLKGIVIPTQLLPTSHHQHPQNKQYEEAVTVLAFDSKKNTILSRIDFRGVVSYESKIEIEAELNFKNKKFIGFGVQFHKTGSYPFYGTINANSKVQVVHETQGTFKNKPHTLFQLKSFSYIEALACIYSK